MKWAIIEFRNYDIETTEFETQEQAEDAYENLQFNGYGSALLVEIKGKKEFFAGRLINES